MKRFNATCRKGSPDWSILTEREASNLRRLAEVTAYNVTDKKGQFKGFPSYNLSNIKRNRDRLAQLSQASRVTEPI